MLLLRRRFGTIMGSLLVSVVMAMVMATLFHSPEIDGSFLHTAALLVPWFGVSWFRAGMVAITLWPNTRMHV
jgi:hypothetical protein